MYIYKNRAVYIMGTVVTTVRIDEELLKEAKRRQIKISKVLEESLRQILAEKRKQEAKRAAKEVARKLRGVDIQVLIDIVREMRESA